MNVVPLQGVIAGAGILSDRDGTEHVLVVAKATYTFDADGVCRLADEQVPLALADAHMGEPGASGVRWEADYALRKPRCDILLNASAHAPGGAPAHWVDVTLSCAGHIEKTVRVHGDRTWRRRWWGGWEVTPAEPFSTMPLTWDRSYGGWDRTDPDEANHACERANPLGMGFYQRRHRDLDGSPLPNVLVPGADPAHPAVHLAAVGCGAVGRSWLPRATRAGTYDQRWRDERFPFLPEDFDDHYHQSAPDDQTTAYLTGGEAIVMRGVCPEGDLHFVMPAFAPPMRLVTRDGDIELAGALDTVIIEPDLRRCILVRRASHRLPGKPTDIREVWVGQPSPARLRARATGKRFRDFAAGP